MLPEEVTKFIGQSGEVIVLEIDKGSIRRFVEATDDPKPIYLDEEYARNSRYSAIIAPPGFFGWPIKREGSAPDEGPLTVALADAGFRNNLNGGEEFEFFQPIRAGDTLASLSKTIDIKEREGRTGNMAFVTTETTYTNQHGDLVAKVRQTLIIR